MIWSPNRPKFADHMIPLFLIIIIIIMPGRHEEETSTDPLPRRPPSSCGTCTSAGRRSGAEKQTGQEVRKPTEGRGNPMGPIRPYNARPGPAHPSGPGLRSPLMWGPPGTQISSTLTSHRTSALAALKLWRAALFTCCGSIS